MKTFQTRAGATSYGHRLGILLLECQQPFIPGDVGNASTWDYPVLYHTMAGCTIERLIFDADTSLREVAVQAAQALQAQGVRAITSNCGFMLRFQADVARAVSIPVGLSSLLQLPFILAASGGRPVAVFTASGTMLTPELLALAGVPKDAPLIVYGMDQHPAFDEPFMQNSGHLDQAAVEQAVRQGSRDLLRRHPDLGAVLLECADLPPYAHAVQEETGLPVYDFTTMADMMVASGRRRAFSGDY